MKKAQKSDSLPEETQLGEQLRLSRYARQKVIEAIHPVFVPNDITLSEEGERRLARAIIGPGGWNIFTSRHLLVLIHGEKKIRAWWAALLEAEEVSRNEDEVEAEEDAGEE